jgi:hypothetical protein
MIHFILLVRYIITDYYKNGDTLLTNTYLSRRDEEKIQLEISIMTF